MASFISVHQLTNGSEIAALGTDEHIVDLGRFNAEGFFSLQIELTGAGQVDINWSMSNNYNAKDNTGDFITPVGIDPIFDDFNSASGPGADGKDIVSFDMLLGRWAKFIVTENAGGICTVKLWLAIQ